MPATWPGLPPGMEALAERRIRAAIEAGEFDGLRGKGRPLRLDDDTMTEAEWRTAFRMLQSAGLAPAWIETRKEIEAAVERARAALAAVPTDDPGWADAVMRFAAQARLLNRRIADLNLSVPSPRWTRPAIDVQVEIACLSAIGRPERDVRPPSESGPASTILDSDGNRR